MSQIAKGLKNPNNVFQHLAKKPFKFIDEYFNYGTIVFDREWDLLIILDACRYDLFLDFAPRHSVYHLLDSVDHTYSIASQTTDWVQRTLDGADDSVLSRTLYITGNGQVENVETGKLYDVRHAWRHTHVPGTHIPRPEAVTDEAIRSFRTTDVERYIVHYVQPHAPFLHCLGKYNSVDNHEGSTQNVWKGLRNGEFDKKDVWEDYGKNLLLVLDHVERLIENFDGKVVITADHGNAMGEFGLYGHPGREAAPSIRRVPWAVTNGLALNNYEVKSKRDDATENGNQDSDLNQHLSDLGYQT